MRKLILAGLILLSATCSFAQNAVISKDSIYTISNFSGMLTSHVSRYLIKENSALQAINVLPNEKYGSLSKRSKRLLLSTAATSAVKSLYRYYKSDNTKYTIATYSTFLSYISDAGAEVKLYSTATDSKKWSFVTYKDNLIGMNGTDNAKKWDGKVLVTADTDAARTAGDLVTDLGAPFAELDSDNEGNDLDASSWYQYKVAFYNGTSYTFSNSRSNPILTGSSVYNIYLTDIPLGPKGTTSRTIYRTSGAASRTAVLALADTAFFMVATLSDNSTQVYADAISDTTLETDRVPVWTTAAAGVNVTVPKSKYALINTERLFIGNDPSGVDSGKSNVYWSDILNPDYFYYGTDYQLIRHDDGDEITFLGNWLGILTVGKTRTISKLYTTASSSTSWKISNPFSYIGCISPFSAVNTDKGIAYLGHSGIYIFNGQTSTLVSDSVTDKVRDILATNSDDVVAVYNDNKYYMSYTSAESGATANDRVLVLDIARNSYYLNTMEIDSFANFDSGDDFGTLYSGSSGSDGNIYAHKNDYNRLIYRYKSQFNGGTSDSIRVGGEETSPVITLGDSVAWEDLGAGTWATSGDWTWITHDLTGEWYSPIIQIDATSLDKLYWNESLKTSGNITFAVKLAATSGGIAGASWSSEFTDPSGADLSGLTANNYIQIRASLSSTIYTESPELFLSDSFVFNMTYKKEGTTGETSILSVWQSGAKQLKGGSLPKRIKEIQLYYEGTEGTLNYEIENESGTTWDFDVDLSVLPNADSSDAYWGTNENKIFVYMPHFTGNIVGRTFTFKVTESGTEQWKIKKMLFRSDINSFTTFK